MTEIDWNAYRFIFDILQAVGTVSVMIYVWWINRSRATKSAIEEVDDKITTVKHDVRNELHGIDRRLGDVENGLRHLPDHRDLAAIHEKVNDVAGTMKQVSGELSSMNRTLDLINEFLINKGSDK